MSSRFAGQHSGDENSWPGQLRGLPSEPPARRERGARVLPFEEVLGLRSEGPDPRFVAIGRNDELVGPEQLLVALGHAQVTLVGVPAQLLDALGHRVDHVRALALDDDERDAVDEQHDVRRNEVLGLSARLVDPELVDRQEVVALRVVEVDEPHALRPALIPVRQARHGHALQQTLSHALIDLDELANLRARERRDSFGEPGVVKPGEPSGPGLILSGLPAAEPQGSTRETTRAR